MKRILGAMIFLFMIHFCNGTEMQNLLKNPAMKEKGVSGLPLAWEFRCKDTVGVKISEDGTILLDPVAGGPGIMLIQRNMKQPSGEPLLFRCQLKGGEYRIYFEWKFTDDGKLKTRAVSTGWQKAPENWKNIALPLAPLPDTYAPYLVIQIRGTTPLQLKNLFYGVLQKEILPNAKLEHQSNGKPSPWECRGPMECFTFSQSEVTMKQIGKEIPLLVNQKVILAPKQQYEVSCEIKGNSGAKYRFYLESVEKKSAERFQRTVERCAGKMGKDKLYSIRKSRSSA